MVSANPDAHGVWHFDVETGDAERVPGTEQIALPNAISFSADGSMYVTDTISGSVRLAPPDGMAEQWLQHEMLLGTESLGYPFPVGANGITIDDASSTVYVAVLEQGTLVTIPIEDGGSSGKPMVHTEFTGADGVAMVDGIAMDAAGSIYVAQPVSNTVVRVTPDGAIETVATAADGLDGPTSLAIGRGTDAGDILYVANFSAALAPHVPPDGAGPGVVMIPLGQDATLGPTKVGASAG